MQPGAEFVLLIACEDRRGIVAAVANSIASQNCNIVESSQYGDANTGRFFMARRYFLSAGNDVGKFFVCFHASGHCLSTGLANQRSS